MNIFDKEIVLQSPPQVKIVDVLSAFPKKKGIKFIEVGASDGIRNDYIYDKVRKFRWSGILIEPEPKSFKKLSKNYSGFKRVILENIAISDISGTGAFHIGKSKSTSSLDRSQASGSRESIIVDIFTLNDVILKYSFGDIDVLQIDAEGNDFKVIKGIDLQKYAPKIIHYEHRHLSSGDKSECENHLCSYGYQLYFNRNNTVATRSI